MKYKPLTRAQSKLLDTAAIIYREGATKKDAAFIARELVQATCPTRTPVTFLCGSARTAT